MLDERRRVAHQADASPGVAHGAGEGEVLASVDVGERQELGDRAPVDEGKPERERLEGAKDAVPARIHKSTSPG